MKTNKKRVEELENGQSQNPIVILWGDENDDAICRVGDEGPALAWDDAIAQFAQTHTIIRVRYVDDWRANETK